MSDNGRWVKVWCHAPADPKIASLTDQEFRVWITVLCYVKQHGWRGSVTLTEAALDLLAATAKIVTVTLCNTMPKLPHFSVTQESNGSVTVTVEQWSKYQEDTTNAARQKAWRERNDDKKRREESIGGGPSDRPPKGMEPKVDAPGYPNEHGAECKCQWCLKRYPGPRSYGPGSRPAAS